MHTPTYTPRQGSYAAILLFVVGSLLGLMLLPKLSVQLHPKTTGSQLIVSVAWPGASPEALEQQITSLIEGLCSTVQGVAKISSTTGYSRATISLQLDKDASAERLRFEVAQRLRQLYPKLPNGVTYPILRLNAPDESGSRTLFMTLQVNGNSSAPQLTRLAEELLKPRLAQIREVYSVQVYGQPDEGWQLRYDEPKLTALGLSPDALLKALRPLTSPQALGKTLTTSADAPEALLGVTAAPIEASEANALPLLRSGDRLLSLADLAQLSTVPVRSDQYFRLNGRTAVQVVLVARADANQLVASSAVRAALADLAPLLPPDHGVRVEYDAADYLRENLSRMAVQSGAALALLVLVILLSVRQIKYSMLILVSLTVNLLLSVVVFYLFGITLHLYSLAALTVSLGLLVDNSIVMIDHYGRYRNRRVMTALLGATLTTWAALSVIWFLPDQTRNDLMEFGWILLITLATSLVVAYGFVPACMEQWRMATQAAAPTRFRRTWLVRLDRAYAAWIPRLVRFRVPLAILALLGFGLPFFMLPKKLPDTASPQLAKFYTQTFGTDYYQEHIRPYLDKPLGGALRLFVNFVYEKGFYNSQERTVLHVNAGLPTSSTPEQMNELLVHMEEELKKYSEIERFVSQVYSGQQGGITIYFKKEHESSGFPYRLKAVLIARSIETSGVDWSIYGVGQGFSQRVNDQGQTSFNLTMRGYQYEQLEQWAERLAQRLLEHPRIQEVDINRTPGGWSHKNVYRYTLLPDLYDLTQRGVQLRQLQSVLLTQYNSRPAPDFYWETQGKPKEVRLQATQQAGVWELQERPIALTEQQSYRLPASTSLVRSRVMPEIRKEDQQYIRQVSYEYLGNYTFGAKNQKKVLDLFKGDLPPGYSVREAGMFDWWGQSGQRQYGLVGLVLLLIFLLGAILFESLRQAAALIVLVLLSFTGIFLIFYLTEFNFDQGGYASFLLVAGLSVNAFLFIIHEYNHQRKRGGLTSLKAYQKAIRYKIRPILLSIFTTVVGLTPFLWEAAEQAFWPALALGTMGGLLVSWLVLLVVMPSLMVSMRFSRSGGAFSAAQ